MDPTKYPVYILALLSIGTLVFLGILPADQYELPNYGHVSFQPEFPASEITPTLEILPTLVPTALSPCYVSPLIGLNIRSGPSVDNPVVGHAYVGSPYRVLEVRFVDFTSHSDEWVRVEFEGGMGWMVVFYNSQTYAKYQSDSCSYIRFPE
jgi:hypothetical protein